MERVGQYIESLLNKGEYKQSDVARAIAVHRQMLSYVIADRRELSISLDQNFEQLEPKYDLKKEQMREYILQKLKNATLV